MNNTYSNSSIWKDLTLKLKDHETRFYGIALSYDESSDNFVKFYNQGKEYTIVKFIAIFNKSDGISLRINIEEENFGGWSILFQDVKTEEMNDRLCILKGPLQDENMIFSSDNNEWDNGFICCIASDNTFKHPFLFHYSFDSSVKEGLQDNLSVLCKTDDPKTISNFSNIADQRYMQSKREVSHNE